MTSSNMRPNQIPIRPSHIPLGGGKAPLVSHISVLFKVLLLGWDLHPLSSPGHRPRLTSQVLTTSGEPHSY